MPKDPDAQKVLLALLSPRQSKTLKEHGWIEIFGTTRIYRINILDQEVVGNVTIYYPGEISGSSRCAHQLPSGPGWNPWQTYLSQYLLISASKKDWLAVSHKYYSYIRVRNPTLEIP